MAARKSDTAVMKRDIWRYGSKKEGYDGKEETPRGMMKKFVVVVV